MGRKNSSSMAELKKGVEGPRDRLHGRSRVVKKGSSAGGEDVKLIDYRVDLPTGEFSKKEIGVQEKSVRNVLLLAEG